MHIMYPYTVYFSLPPNQWFIGRYPIPDSGIFINNLTLEFIGGGHILVLRIDNGTEISFRVV